MGLKWRVDSVKKQINWVQPATDSLVATKKMPLKKENRDRKPFSQNVRSSIRRGGNPSLFSHLLLELPRFLTAAVADPHRVVPAAGGHRAPLLRAVVAHALAAGATVVDGETRGELPLALAAGGDVLIWDPVSRAGRVLHQTWTQRMEEAGQ